ncbi:MAG: RluA family pseudouridine synthase [Candidatus Doudnabacteria bacterium]|nr:RluA family pseudouridine synthase [Candidatus Doudnabacteria bacterium]
MLDFIANVTNRLDKFLASKIDVSRARIQKSIRNGDVSVDGIIIMDPDFDVRPGTKVSLPEFGSEELTEYNLDLKVVFENDDLLVIDKPAGLVVHPGAGNKDKTLANILISKYPNIKDVGDPHRPGIVHRLDEDTSGLMVIAKTSRAYDFLKEIFHDRSIEKEYLALVHGIPEKLHGIIDLPIAKAPSHRKMKVGEGKEAKTEYSVLVHTLPGSLDEYALLRVKLHTGRTHQIRVHMNAIGHPLVGDQTYGKYQKADRALVDRQFLHAYRLKFKLMDQTWIELISPLPEDLQAFLTRIGITYEDQLI